MKLLLRVGLGVSRNQVRSFAFSGWRIVEPFIPARLWLAAMVAPFTLIVGPTNSAAPDMHSGAAHSGVPGDSAVPTLTPPRRPGVRRSVQPPLSVMTKVHDALRVVTERALPHFF